MTQKSINTDTHVLIVDDDAAVAWALEQAVRAEGYEVRIAADAASAKRMISRQRPDVVMTDVCMPGESGLALLAYIHKRYPNLPVVVMTAHGTMETAIEAVQQGAFEYIIKPLDLDAVSAVLARIHHHTAVAVSVHPENPPAPVSYIIGNTPAMQEVYRRIAASAATDMGVLISGPTGSGKELVASALHRHSQRSTRPFIAVNCGALPHNLMESELFGHESGAFTDAKEQSIGRIEAADGGTLFLDEIGELSAEAQVKLLRFLEDQSIMRVGGHQAIQVNVRIIAATNRSIDSMVAADTFRADLAFRIKVVRIELPPLCQRLDDLPALVEHLLTGIAERLNKHLHITDEAMSALSAYPWPGNVRELKHILEEAAVLSTGGRICATDMALPTSTNSGIGTVPVAANLNAIIRSETARLAHAQEAKTDTETEAGATSGTIHQQLIDRVEAAMISEALAQTQGNQLRAAALLGINRITLKKRMTQLF